MLFTVLDELGITLSAKEMKMNIRPLLRVVCTRFLEDMCGFVDMCVTHIPNPKDNALAKVSHIYTGPTDSPLAQDMIDCNPDVSSSSTHVTYSAIAWLIPT